jgi:hypothetical protein
VRYSAGCFEDCPSQPGRRSCPRWSCEGPRWRSRRECRRRRRLRRLQEVVRQSMYRQMGRSIERDLTTRKTRRKTTRQEVLDKTGRPVRLKGYHSGTALCCCSTGLGCCWRAGPHCRRRWTEGPVAGNVK